MRRPEIRFGTRFVAWTVALWLAFTASPALLRALIELTVGATVSLSSGLGLEPYHLSPITLAFAGGSFALEIGETCTAYEVAILFTAAVLAHGSPLARRVAGIAAGLPFIFAFNVLRLVSLGWLSVHLPWAYDGAHVLIWQAAFVASVALVWLLWATWADPARADRLVTSRRRALLNALLFAGAFLTFGVVAHAAGLALPYFDVVRGLSDVVDVAIGGAPRVDVADGRASYYVGEALAVACIVLVHHRAPAKRRLAVLLAFGATVVLLQGIRLALLAGFRETGDEAFGHVHDILAIVSQLVLVTAWLACARAERSGVAVDASAAPREDARSRRRTADLRPRVRPRH